jgi:uncharacterized damage-inducible protein DinB
LRLIVSFYRYNSDVRKKYLDAMEKLPWKEVIRDRGASFPSIRNVFLHVLNAYRYWFQYAIYNDLKDYRGIDPKTFSTVDAIRKHELEVDSMVMSLIGSLREEDLSKVHVIQDGSVTHNVTMEAILMHMIEEELQHRGEINCMFWQQNIDPPIIEYGEWVGQWTNL